MWLVRAGDGWRGYAATDRIPPPETKVDVYFICLTTRQIVRVLQTTLGEWGSATEETFRFHCPRCGEEHCVERWGAYLWVED